MEKMKYPKSREIVNDHIFLPIEEYEALKLVQKAFKEQNINKGQYQNYKTHEQVKTKNTK